MSSQVTKIDNVVISVADQDKAVEFYTEALGLEMRADVPIPGGGRWVEVAPAGAETQIAICPPGPDVTAGNKQTGITLQTGDVDGLHTKLKEQGVDVDEVKRFGDGVPAMFWFRDPEGNSLTIVEEH